MALCGRKDRETDGKRRGKGSIIKDDEMIRSLNRSEQGRRVNNLRVCVCIQLSTGKRETLPIYSRVNCECDRDSSHSGNGGW